MRPPPSKKRRMVQPGESQYVSNQFQAMLLQKPIQTTIDIKNIPAYTPPPGPAVPYVTSIPVPVPSIPPAPKPTQEPVYLPRKRKQKVNCVQKRLLTDKMQAIAKHNKLSLSQQAVDYLVLALQERLRLIMETIVEISQERLEYKKSKQIYKIASSPKVQISEIQQREKEERTRKRPNEYQDRPMTLRTQHLITKKDFMVYLEGDEHLKSNITYHILKMGMKMELFDI